MFTARDTPCRRAVGTHAYRYARGWTRLRAAAPGQVRFGVFASRARRGLHAAPASPAVSSPLTEILVLLAHVPASTGRACRYFALFTGGTSDTVGFAVCLGC